MRQDGVQRILAILGADHPTIAQAINGGEQTRFDKPGDEFLGIWVPPPSLLPNLFDRFRESGLVISYTVNFEGPELGIVACVGFYPARPATLPPICYHTASVDDEQGIRFRGIRTGESLGRESRERFPTSRHYICVSATEGDARAWAMRLHSGKPALIFPIKSQGSGLRFIEDPSSSVPSGGVNGYIVVGKHISPELLGDPIRVEALKS